MNSISMITVESQLGYTVQVSLPIARAAVCQVVLHMGTIEEGSKE